MMTNQNTEYEKLVADIHQGMLKYDGFENIRVEHNVTITGKSGATHQLDIYWEFKAAGATYRTVVECKNYTSPVKKSHVATLASVLSDIGNANGIIATTSSFQKGAKQLAEHNNIRLVTVNNLLKSIHIQLQPRATDYENVVFNFNQDSIREALIRNELDSYTANWSLSGQDYFLDSDGSEIETLNSFIRKSPKHEGSNIIENINMYLDIGNIGLVMVDSLAFDVIHRELPIIESIIEFPYSAKAVIEDIVNNNIHYIHEDGSVSENIDA